MEILLQNMKSINLSIVFMLFYIILFLYSLFNGKISSRFYMSELKKIIKANDKIVDELINELVENSKVREKCNEYFNCLWKGRLYSLIGVASLVQLIMLMIKPNIDQVSSNVCMLTMTISFLESRDNRTLAKNIKKEFDIEVQNINDNYYEMKKMATEDFVLDKLLKEQKITAEKKAEIIKSNSVL